MILNIVDRISLRCRTVGRHLINTRNRKELKNHNFSLITNNCTGGFLLHDLNMRFCTPTINLWFKPCDFIEFLQHLEYYIHTELLFSDDDEQLLGYPVGILGGNVKVYFQHYKSRAEAKDKWIKRCNRVNMDNIYIMMTDQDGCTRKNIQDFESLPFKNKIIFTHKPYPEFPSTFYIKGFEGKACVHRVFDMKGKWTGKKHYDDFPFVKWFNGELGNH